MGSLKLYGDESQGNNLSYEWTDGSDNTIGTSSTQVVTSADTYTLTVTDAVNGIIRSTSVIVGLNTDAPTVIITSDDGTVITSSGQVITLVATGASVYLWSTGETTASIDITSGDTYTVTGVTSSNSCSATDSIVITEDISDLSVFITNDNGTFLGCPTPETTLTANVSGVVGTVSIQWYSNASSLLVGVGPTYTVTQSDEYGVLVTNTGNSNYAGAGETILNYPPGGPIADISGSLVLPCNDTITLSASGSTGNGTLSYEWTGVPSTMFSGSTTNETVIVDELGTVTLRVYNGDGIDCEDTITHVVNISDGLIVNINPQSSNIPDPTITMSATITGNATPPFIYAWKAVPDLIVGNHDDPTVEVSGACRLGLIVTDWNSCADEDRAFIILVAEDTQRPTTPTNFYAQQSGVDTLVICTWNLSTDNIAVDRYEVFRSLGINQIGYELIGSVSHPQNQYNDLEVFIHEEYDYKVRAVDTSELVSLNFSNTSEVIMQSSCFVEGTKIQTLDGIKPIEDLMNGDELLSSRIESLNDTNNVNYLHDWSDGELNNIITMSTIKEIYPFETNNTIIINKGLLEATPTHTQLIYRDDKWIFIEMGDIKVGDKLYDINNNIIDVTDCDVNSAPRIAYKLELNSPTHMYFANGILTHNAKAPI